MNNGVAASFQDNSAHREDALVMRELSDTSCLDAVLDGVTHCQGAYASGFTAQLLQDMPIANLGDLIKVLEEANSTLYKSGMGRNLLTTVSVALKIGDQLKVVNAGDSPVYLIRGGEIQELSTIAKSGLLPGPVSGSVGVHRLFKYEYRGVTLQPGDRLLLATDGLVDNLFPDELADVVKRADTPQEAISALKELIAQKRRLHRGRSDTYGTFKEDDQTAIVRSLN